MPLLQNNLWAYKTTSFDSRKYSMKKKESELQYYFK